MAAGQCPPVKNWPDWTATAGAGFRVLQQTLLPMVALGHATAAVAGQSYGAGLVPRVQRASWIATRWMFCYGLLVTSLLFFTGRGLGHIFAQTEESLDLAQIYYWWSAPTVLAFSLSFVPSSVLQALSRPSLPLIAALARIGALTILVLWIIPSLGLGPEWIFGASSGTTFIEGGLGTYLMWRHFRGMKKGHASDDPPPTSSEDRRTPTPSDSLR